MLLIEVYTYTRTVFFVITMLFVTVFLLFHISGLFLTLLLMIIRYQKCFPVLCFKYGFLCYFPIIWLYQVETRAACISPLNCVHNCIYYVILLMKRYYTLFCFPCRLYNDPGRESLICPLLPFDNESVFVTFFKDFLRMIALSFS